METLSEIVRLITWLILSGTGLMWARIIHKEVSSKASIRVTQKDIESIADEIQARENGKLSQSKEIDEIMKP